MDDEELARHPEATRGAASVPANHSPIALQPTLWRRALSAVFGYDRDALSHSA